MICRAIVCASRCFLAWSLLTAFARADGDFVILGERGAFWTNNRSASVCKLDRRTP